MLIHGVLPVPCPLMQTMEGFSGILLAPVLVFTVVPAKLQNLREQRELEGKGNSDTWRDAIGLE